MPNQEEFAALLQEQTIVLKELAKQVKTVSGVQEAPLLHGVGGLFSTPGLDQVVVTAHMRPKGISSVLPTVPTVEEDPRFGTITGFQEDGSEEPDTACEDAPKGYMKGANLTARLGMTRRDTNEIDIGKVMLKVNRGDMTDLILQGKILGDDGLSPDSVNDTSEILRVLTTSEMVIASVGAERKLSKEIWRGVTTNTNEFPGLDVQIATGHMDADTSTLAPALDSLIMNFAGNLVCGATLDIVTYLSAMEYDLVTRADSMGLEPVDWVISMTPQLWFELSACWPALYFTHRSGTLVRVDGTEMIEARDAMRRGRYIDINGTRYTVVTDTGIFEQNNANTAGIPAGQYQSHIYFVPLTIVGGMPVTYRNYLDFSKTQNDAALLNNMQTFWTDGGIYTWAIENQKWCYKLSLRTEQRIVLRAPHLAGKLQNVRYSPINHIRDPYPESPYFADGGVSTRPSSYGDAVWA